MAKFDLKTLLKVEENFMIPKRLLEVVLDEKKRIALFDEISKNVSFEEDFLRDYFQNNLADRKSQMQDYTPDCLCELVSRLSNYNCASILDICAGTGSLTVAQLCTNSSGYYVMEERSKASIPFLILNFAIRNVSCLIIEKDVLTKEIRHIYQLDAQEKYSSIQVCEMPAEDSLQEFDLVISNPPYSAQWLPKADERFIGYELAPKSKADFAFILDGLYRLKQDGTAIYILPHGVLFREQSEGKIRKQLIENNLIDAIIGLPSNLFLNTSIPVLILILRKNKTDKSILFIDASKEFNKAGKQNIITKEKIEKIQNAYINRKEIDKFCHIARYDEIEQNKFNLNITRYVDTFEPDPIPELGELLSQLEECDKAMHQNNYELVEMLMQLRSTIPGDAETNMQIKKFAEYLRSKL